MFRVCAIAQKKIEHLLDDPLNKKDFIYLHWLANTCCLITQILNIIEQKVSFGVIFLTA